MEKIYKMFIGMFLFIIGTGFATQIFKGGIIGTIAFSLFIVFGSIGVVFIFNKQLDEDGRIKNREVKLSTPQYHY